MKIETILVAGAGLMGRGIVEVAALAGYRVWWSDLAPEIVNKSLDAIRDSVARRVAKNKITAEDGEKILAILAEKVSVAASLEDGREADLAIEAVPEKPELKSGLLAKLGAACKTEALIVSNTSTLSITGLAAHSGRPEQFMGMHFFSPVPVMSLVELIRGVRTADETFAAVREAAVRMGKEPVVAPDSPGFIVNRILLLAMNEAFHLVALGADPKDVDQAMRLGCNHPMGLLELGDYTGLDVVAAALESMHAATGDAKFKPCVYLQKLVEAGLLGRKTGRGVYPYE
jgi:3-hydroxybutyryl-CoA dehydrogenase